MKLGTRKKQPGEKRQYGIDYAKALDPGDEIISVTNVVEPAGITVLTTNSEDRVRLSALGGTDGVTYKVTMTVTTTNTNEIIEDEIYIKVKEI